MLNSIKSGVNFVRVERNLLATNEVKKMWFDKLHFTEKQRLFNELKGRKLNYSQFITENDKIWIYNKIHFGDYLKFG